MKTNDQSANARLLRILGGGIVVTLIFGGLLSWLAPNPPMPAAAPAPSVSANSTPSREIQQAAFAPQAPEVAENKIPQYEVLRTTDSPLSDLRLSFKLDPRITRGLHMGDRWVSPPTYLRAGDETQCTFEAKVEGVNAQGMMVDIDPQWTATTPELVTVSPSQGKEVQITVQRPGQGVVEVSALGFAKRLPITASYQGNVLMVQLAQR